jgi:hypothetical protein
MIIFPPRRYRKSEHSDVISRLNGEFLEHARLEAIVGKRIFIRLAQPSNRKSRCLSSAPDGDRKLPMPPVLEHNQLNYFRNEID